MKHIPRKRFGQNFLKDSAVLYAIIDAIAPRSTDCMLEIGPGLGAMTEKLLPHLERLDVVELDRDLAAYLKGRFPPDKLTVHQADALDFDINTICTHPDRKIRIVGNLPYNISTPLLFRLMTFADRVMDQHFMLQREVVERMVAEPGSKAFGRLSVMLQWRYDMEMLFIVPPTAFDPAPKVDSAIVRMIPRENPEDCSPEALEKVVTQAFSQRRKILRNNLAPYFTETELNDLGIDPEKRPEALSVEQFIQLARHLPPSTSGDVNPLLP